MIKGTAFPKNMIVPSSPLYVTCYFTSLTKSARICMSTYTRHAQLGPNFSFEKSSNFLGSLKSPFTSSSSFQCEEENKLEHTTKSSQKKNTYPKYLATICRSFFSKAQRGVKKTFNSNLSCIPWEQQHCRKQIFKFLSLFSFFSLSSQVEKEAIQFHHCSG